MPRGGTIQRPLQGQRRDVFQPPDGQARNRPAYSAGIFLFSPNLYFLIYTFLNSILIGPFLILFLSLLYSISFFQARTTSCQGSLLCSLRSSRGLTPPPGTGDLLIRSGLHLSRDGHDWFLLVCPAILPLVLRRTSTSYVSVVRLRLTSPSYVLSYVSVLRLVLRLRLTSRLTSGLAATVVPLRPGRTSGLIFRVLLVWLGLLPTATCLG